MKKPHPAGETGQGLQMSGRRCGSPDIQSRYFGGMISAQTLRLCRRENRCPLCANAALRVRIMRAYSITCTMRRVRGSTSTVEPLITVYR